MIDKVYIINLAWEKNKKNKMLSLIEEYKLSTVFKKIEFYEAVDGYSIEIDPTYNFSKGSYGCTMSHLNCMKDAIANGYENILIFEDDIIMDNNFNERWNNIKFPEEWDILYLGGTQLVWELEPKMNEWYKAHTTLGGFAYIVNNKIYQRIIDCYERIKRPIDEVLSSVQKESCCYVMYPNLIIAYLDESTTRKNNTWSLDSYSKQLKWDLSRYNMKMYMGKNLRGTNSLLLYNKIYKKCLKGGFIPFSNK